MLHHFRITLSGKEPRFSKEQQEELETLRQLEASFED